MRREAGPAQLLRRPVPHLPGRADRAAADQGEECQGRVGGRGQQRHPRSLAETPQPGRHRSDLGRQHVAGVAEVFGLQQVGHVTARSSGAPVIAQDGDTQPGQQPSQMLEQELAPAAIIGRMQQDNPSPAPHNRAREDRRQLRSLAPDHQVSLGHLASRPSPAAATREGMQA